MPSTTVRAEKVADDDEIGRDLVEHNLLDLQVGLAGGPAVGGVRPNHHGDECLISSWVTAVDPMPVIRLNWLDSDSGASSNSDLHFAGFFFVQLGGQEICRPFDAEDLARGVQTPLPRFSSLR